MSFINLHMCDVVYRSMFYEKCFVCRWIFDGLLAWTFYSFIKCRCGFRLVPPYHVQRYVMLLFCMYMYIHSGGAKGWLRGASAPLKICQASPKPPHFLEKKSHISVILKRRNFCICLALFAGNWLPWMTKTLQAHAFVVYDAIIDLVNASPFNKRVNTAYFDVVTTSTRSHNHAFISLA